MSQTNIKQETDGEKFIEDPVRDFLTKINNEDMLVEYGNMGGNAQDTEKLQIAKTLFPEQGVWPGKTKLHNHNQALLHTKVRMIPQLYPDMYGDIETEINDFMDYYEQYLTSVEGYARDQQVSIIRSFFSKVAEGAEETRDMFRSFLAGKGDNENED